MNELLQDADLCVKCGLCLQYCPTYRETHNENESPRGRIALIQGWALGELVANEKLLSHIDNCLLCRNCERVCPAGVTYGRLVDHFRSKTRAKSPFSLPSAALKQVAQNKRLRSWAQKAVRSYQRGNRQKILRRLGLPKLMGFGEIDRLLPVSNGFETFSEPFVQGFGDVKGSVALFKGCMGTLLDSETVAAAVRCLTIAGYNVVLPEEQTCCGALAQHEGDIENARRLAERNCRAFADYDVDAVVTIASGCGSLLKEYENRRFAEKVVDISHFLNRSEIDFTERLQPLDTSVCLHTPCTLTNVMREEQGAVKLLQQIPGLTLSLLPESLLCCGSAGSYLLNHPVMAKALAAHVVESLKTEKVEYLATSNIGCALHLAATAREKGIAVEVVHPVVLLARQLPS